jgi:chorismate mutase
MIGAGPEPVTSGELAAIRVEMERIDRAIVGLLGERLWAASALGMAKRRDGIMLFDPEQEARVIRRVTDWAREAALPVEDVRDLFWRIIALSRGVQGDQP